MCTLGVALLTAFNTYRRSNFFLLYSSTLFKFKVLFCIFGVGLNFSYFRYSNVMRKSHRGGRAVTFSGNETATMTENCMP